MTEEVGVGLTSGAESLLPWRSSVLFFIDEYTGQNMSVTRWNSAQVRPYGNVYSCHSVVFSVSKSYFLSGSTCQSQGGFGLERDGTVVPTHTAPLSQRESVIKGDIPALLRQLILGMLL
jgi:hypothetical protein